jgi:hypothetical protein
LRPSRRYGLLVWQPQFGRDLAASIEIIGPIMAASDAVGLTIIHVVFTPPGIDSADLPR